MSRLVLLLLIAMLWCSGCQTAQPSADPQPAASAASERRRQITVDAPESLQDIAGFLLRFHSLHHRLPLTLHELREKQIMPWGGYANLERFAYHPDGLGRLPDGRMVLVVDYAVRIDGHAWCILQQPGTNAQTVALDVTLVPLATLRQIAGATRR